MDAEALEALRRSMDLTLDLEGRWLHEGQHFDNQRVSDLFSRGIDLHEETGEPIVRIGHQWAYFTAQDTPFIVRRLIFEADALKADLNSFEVVTLSPEALSVGEDGVLYADLGGRRARLSRHAHSQLTDRVEDTEAGPVVRLARATLPIQPL